MGADNAVLKSRADALGAENAALQARVDSLGADLATAQAQADQAELDKNALRMQLATRGAGGVVAALASGSCDISSVIPEQLTEYGRNIMRRCGAVADKAVAAVTANMQATIDDLVIDKEALEATTEELQLQVQHWHDVASNLAAAPADPPAAATPEETAQKVEAEFSTAGRG